MTASNDDDGIDNSVIPHTMKAVVVRELGGPDSLSYETDYPVPSDLLEGQVLVRNEYAGLNFIDTYFRSGLYKQNLPFIAGQEGAGIVVKVNINANANANAAADDDCAKVGDRVVYSTLGTYCEYTRVPVDKLVKVQASVEYGKDNGSNNNINTDSNNDSNSNSSEGQISIEAALCSMVQGMTAHYLVTDATAGLTQIGDWMLMYSVGSGTCQWACQLAKLKGYRVIGTTSQSKITAAARVACDHLIVLDTEEGSDKSYADYSSVDIHQKVMEITDGNGVKCVIDGVGRSTADTSVKCLAKRGLWISFGNASGAVPPFSLLKLTPKSGYVTRPKLGDYVATKEELRARAKEIFGYVASGELKVGVDMVFPLCDAKKGHEYLEAGKSKGKILFRI